MDNTPQDQKPGGLKLTPLHQIKDKLVGAPGTPEREQHEAELATDIQELTEQRQQLRAGYAQGLQQILAQSLADYFAELDRLLPQHATPFNEGWLARTHTLPRYAPGSSPQPSAWVMGWDSADDAPREGWAMAKSKLLAPRPVPGPPAGTRTNL